MTRKISQFSEEGDVDFYRNVITDDLEAAGIGSEESSTDEDFDPNAHDSDAKAGGDEEYDSDFADRSTDSEDRESGDGSVSKILDFFILNYYWDFDAVFDFNDDNLSDS